MRRHEDHPGVTIRPRNGSFQIRWREVINDKEYRKSLTYSDYNEAFKEAVVISARLGIVEHASRIAGDLAVRPGVLSIAIQEFFRHLKTKNRSSSENPNSKKLCLLRCARLFQWTTTCDLTAKNLRNAIQYYVENDMRSSAHTSNATLRHFIGWCHKKYKVPSDALEVKASKPPESDPCMWTKEEQQRLMKYLRNPPRSEDVEGEIIKGSPAWREKIRRAHRRPALLLLAEILWIELSWALRPKELGGLTVSMFHEAERMLKVPGWLTKNGCPRTIVPLDEDSYTILKARCAGRRSNEPIFLTAKGAVWKTEYQSRRMRPVIAELGLPGTLYASRHTATTRLVNGLQDMKHAMEITGHKTLSQLQKYIHKQRDNVGKYGQGLRDAILGEEDTKKS